MHGVQENAVQGVEGPLSFATAKEEARCRRPLSQILVELSFDFWPRAGEEVVRVTSGEPSGYCGTLAQIAMRVRLSVTLSHWKEHWLDHEIQWIVKALRGFPLVEEVEVFIVCVENDAAPFIVRLIGDEVKKIVTVRDCSVYVRQWNKDTDMDPCYALSERKIMVEEDGSLHWKPYPRDFSHNEMCLFKRNAFYLVEPEWHCACHG
jgi:hypothetical protein